MVFTAAQTQAFFTDAAQMAIPAASLPLLNAEGINAVADLVDYDKDTILQVAENLKRPGDRIPNPDPDAPAGATIPRPPYTFGAKSQKRLGAACDIVCYYETVGRPLTAANMRYTTIIRNFAEQWKALNDRKGEEIEVPKVTRSLPVLKWVEAFQDFLHRKIGARGIPLAYVVRETVQVPPIVPPLATDRPHSIMYGSVEAELIARASHDHPLFRDDNSSVYYLLEEALRGTSLAPSLKPFQRGKDGRSAVMSVTSQYAGLDKWEAELKKQDEFLHNPRWKGNSNFPLERFVAQHRNAFVSMTQCAQHVQFQLPNEYTRVGYLLTAIQSSDAKLQAAMANVDGDTGIDGKRNNFESAASYLLPKDPVARQRSGKRPHAEIADVDAPTAEVSAFGAKQGKGKKTGVHFRYYKPEEYKKLSKAQQNELREWRKTQKKSGTPEERKQAASTTHATLSSSVAKEVEKQLNVLQKNAAEEESVEQAMESWVSSCIEKHSKKSSSATKASESDVPKAKSSALKSILKRVKNSEGTS